MANATINYDTSNISAMRGLIMMDSGARLTFEGRWLTYSRTKEMFQVMERKPYQKNTRVLIETEDETNAVIVLINGEKQQ